MIYLAADHGGYALKEKIKRYLDKRGEQYTDVGATILDTKDDYPIYAEKLGKAVVVNQAKGIGICSSGVGMSIAVNKVNGIRAVEANNIEEARFSRLDNDANVLVLGAKFFDDESGWKIIDAWLDTPFSGEERHIRRIKEISDNE
jgi:ribose 5-phosphate isomerase B